MSNVDYFTVWTAPYENQSPATLPTHANVAKGTGSNLESIIIGDKHLSSCHLCLDFPMGAIVYYLSLIYVI